MDCRTIRSLATPRECLRQTNGQGRCPSTSLRGTTMTGEETVRAQRSPNTTLILYDGVCGLCNRFVSLLLRHDRRDEFRFAPLQSEFARSLLRRHGLNQDDLDTVVVLPNFGCPNEQALTRSLAVLCAADRLGGIWSLLTIAKWLPGPLREAIYRFIARHRYCSFGKHDQCLLPRPEDRHKFLA